MYKTESILNNNQEEYYSFRSLSSKLLSLSLPISIWYQSELAWCTPSIPNSSSIVGIFLKLSSLCISFFFHRSLLQSFFNSLLSLILETKLPVKPSSSFFNGFRICQYRFRIICFSNLCACLGKTVQSLFSAQ